MPPGWGGTALLALAAFTPVSSTFWNGQLAGLLLLALVAGLDLHRRGRTVLAGLVLSLLALKPTLAIGPVLWLLFRLDWRALLGLAVGILVQAGLTVLLLGSDLFLPYLDSFGHFRDLAYREIITPDHQHALAGILTYLAKTLSSQPSPRRMQGDPRPGRGRWGRGVARHCPPWPRDRRLRVEYAAVGVLTVLAPPHLHTYDVVVLLVPIVLLLNLARDPRPREEAGLAVLLYLAGALTFVYTLTQASLVPLAAGFTLFRLACRQTCPNDFVLPRPPRSSLQSLAAPAPACERERYLKSPAGRDVWPQSQRRPIGNSPIAHGCKRRR